MVEKKQVITGMVLDMDFTEPLEEEAVIEMQQFIIKYFKLAGMTGKPKYGKEFETNPHIMEDSVSFTVTDKEWNWEDFKEP